MKKLILLGVTVGVLFAISAGASWLLKQNQSALKEHADADGVGEKGQKVSAGDMRPVVRPPFNADADTAAQMANELRNQKEAFKTREKELVARQKNLEIIHQDMKTERAMVEELRKQCKDELQAVNDQLELLERKSGAMDKKGKQVSEQIKDLNSNVTHIKDLEKDNVKRLANVCDTMDSRAAAELLQRMADMGMIETAVTILATMQNRQTAKILAEFPDKTAAVQILEKMKTVERPPLGKGGL